MVTSGELGARRLMSPTLKVTPSTGSAGRPRKLVEMRVSDVCQSLEGLGLGQHVAAFEKHQVTGAMCDSLDDDLLTSLLGMREAEHRHAFFAWVKRMQRRAECTAMP